MTRIFDRRAVVAAVAALAMGGYAAFAQPQDSAEKAGEKVGRKIDKVVQDVKRGAEKVGENLREGFEAARDKVNAMSVEARVYGRLHWDKALADAPITLEMRESQVILKGSVPDAAAKTKAVALARDTVGVTSVVDELGIADVKATPKPATSTDAVK